MKKLLLPFLFPLFVLETSGQTPAYYYYDPPNVGVNNYYFNVGLSHKCLFIYTQSELDSAGITGPIEITSLWLKSNVVYNVDFDDLKITLGHSTIDQPVATFADNFDAGAPVIVLDEPFYQVTFIAGAWNDPPNGWTEIPLTTPFLYDFNNNLAIQFEYTDDNYPITIYAFNGGPAITQFTDTIGGANATANTARPMIGFSADAFVLSIGASDSTVCEKFCIDYTDLSINDPVEWNWIFEGGSPASSTDQNPMQVCYFDAGVYDVTLITTDSLGESDTLYLPDFITTYPTPPIPIITQNGDTLTSSGADFYQWQLNTADIPGATDQTHVAGESGFYTVITFDSSGCLSSSSLEVEIIGIADIEINGSWNIYPNPSPGIFTISTPDCETGGLSLSVFNSFGQKLYSVTGNILSFSCDVIIDLSDEASGIYLVEIRSGDNYYSRKIMIED